MSKITATGCTPSQNRLVREADPDTGVITGHKQTLGALVARKLAVRQDGVYVLAPLGRNLHDQLNDKEPRPVTVPVAPPDEAAVDFNNGRRNISQLPLGPERTAAVQAAWAGVIAQRRILTDFPEHRPTLWEFQQPVRAVSFALESAGLQPSAVDQYGRCVRDGYRVAPSTRDDCARISLAVPDAWTQVGSRERRESHVLAVAQATALNAYRVALDQRGWVCTRRRGPYSGHAFLIATPRLA